MVLLKSTRQHYVHSLNLLCLKIISKVFSFSSVVASATEEEEKGDKCECEFLFIYINLIVVWKMLSILILHKFLGVLLIFCRFICAFHC